MTRCWLRHSPRRFPAPHGSTTAASFASPSPSTDLPHASKTHPPGGRNGHPATGSSHCCPGLKTRPSQTAARRSRAGPAGNRQGRRLQARHPRPPILPSRQLGQCSHQTAATKPEKPGLHKHACYEYSSTLSNIVERIMAWTRSIDPYPTAYPRGFTSHIFHRFAS